MSPFELHLSANPCANTRTFMHNEYLTFAAEGLANFSPQDGHVIRYVHAIGPRLSRRGGGDGLGD